MKLSKIQDLLRLVAESDVSEVEIEEDDFKLTIRQNSPQVLMQPTGYPAQAGYYGAPQGMHGQAPPHPPSQQAPHPQQPPATGGQPP
ncbi:MAG: acetyl-CoA carboxylase, biotin carboxyl carrier protein, partial [Salinibacter sp.]